MVISDTLPVELENPAVVSSGLMITQTSSVPLKFGVLDYLPGETGEITITAKVQDGFTGVINEQMWRSSRQAKKRAEAQTTGHNLDLNRTPDLVIVKSGNLDGINYPDYEVSYKVNFTNTGDFTATHVLLTDTLPAGLTNLEVNSSGIAITQLLSDPYVFQVADLGSGEPGKSILGLYFLMMGFRHPW